VLNAHVIDENGRSLDFDSTYRSMLSLHCVVTSNMMVSTSKPSCLNFAAACSILSRSRPFNTIAAPASASPFARAKADPPARSGNQGPRSVRSNSCFLPVYSLLLRKADEETNTIVLDLGGVR